MKTYKFSHSVGTGGSVYIQRGKIKNKKALENALSSIVRKYGLADATIKVYKDILFLFFAVKPTIVPTELISCIKKNIEEFGEWDEKYVYTTVEDVSKEYIETFLREFEK